MEQGVGKLVGNAIKVASIGDRFVVRLYKCGEGYPLLDVVDSGCRIPGEKIKEVLNQFFTTMKEGTGL